MSKEKLFDQPTFIISLDTELIWGYVAYPSLKEVSLMKSDDKKVRGCIDILLNLFKKHNIPATWAVVGHLFLDHCECEDGIPHKDMPRFKDDWYSTDPCTDIQKDPLYYGRDIVDKILSNRIEHEIGYHSFSHVVFSECSRKVAEAEIKMVNKLAKEFGITLKSFVFPENKVGHIDVLRENGFNGIIIAVGHLAELVMTFFNDGSKYGINIKYTRENKPLGTAGPLALIKEELNETFLMMNGDVLTTLDFSDLVNYHKRNGAIATIALKKRDVKIDFGVVEIDDGNSIVGYKEKPKIDYLVSMGVYAFEPLVLEYIKPNEYLDFPDLIKKLISNGETVKGYVYDGYWLDIGRPDDYERASRDIDKIHDKLGL